jgi:hypothetical protein
LSWPEAAANWILFNGYFLDGAVMPVQPEDLYKKGKLNAKHVVFGANSMDGVTPFGYACDGYGVCPPPPADKTVAPFGYACDGYGGIVFRQNGVV